MGGSAAKAHGYGKPPYLRDCTLSEIGEILNTTLAQEVTSREASTLCASKLTGAKVASNATGIHQVLMVDASKFHEDADSKDEKHVLCVLEGGYTCEKGHSLVRGRCLFRTNAKMNFVDARKQCKKQGFDLASPGNDLDYQIISAQLGKDAAWIQNSLEKKANKYVWSHAINYHRFTTCDGTSKKLYAGIHNNGCNTPIASVIDRTGYLSNTEQNEMDVICIKNAVNEFTRVQPKKALKVDESCAPLHELNEETGKCDWIGPIDACAQLIDTWNNTHFISMKDEYPNFVDVEEDLKSTGNALNDFTSKVIVRRGCMFTGYAYQLTLTAWQESALVQNALYGMHQVPNYIDNRTAQITNYFDGLTRAVCFCDPTEATVNGHVPSPPADRKCIQHHEFNETTQQCEWKEDAKFCAELITNDNRRMMLEIPNWPKNRKYDVDHHSKQQNLNFHYQVTKIVVRQHCFATTYWRSTGDWQVWKNFPTSGYGQYDVPSSYNNLMTPGVGPMRFVCECIR